MMITERGESESVPAGSTRRRRHGGSRVHHHAAADSRLVTGDGGPAAQLDGGPLVFAAMPFDPGFDDVFFVAIRGAARAAGAHAVRVDYVMHADDAVAQTERLLDKCAVVVADLSSNEADVLYEVGYARALGRPVVQICAATHQSLPFMVRNRETLLYEPGRTYLLVDALASYLGAVLARAAGSGPTDDTGE